jgi:hypothetical protein
VLADELAPAKSLQRLDAVAARVMATVSVVATLITGLGRAPSPRAPAVARAHDPAAPGPSNTERNSSCPIDASTDSALRATVGAGSAGNSA